MTKEKLIELIMQHQPDSDYQIAEELADAILKEQQESWKPIKYKWVNRPSGSIFIGDSSKEDTEWAEPNAMEKLLEEFNEFVEKGNYSDCWWVDKVEKFIESKKDRL